MIPRETPTAELVPIELPIEQVVALLGMQNRVYVSAGCPAVVLAVHVNDISDDVGVPEIIGFPGADGLTPLEYGGAKIGTNAFWYVFKVPLPGQSFRKCINPLSPQLSPQLFFAWNRGFLRPVHS